MKTKTLSTDHLTVQQSKLISRLLMLSPSNRSPEGNIVFFKDSDSLTAVSIVPEAFLVITNSPDLRSQVKNRSNLFYATNSKSFRESPYFNNLNSLPFIPYDSSNIRIRTVNSILAENFIDYIFNSPFSRTLPLEALNQTVVPKRLHNVFKGAMVKYPDAKTISLISKLKGSNLNTLLIAEVI